MRDEQAMSNNIFSRKVNVMCNILWFKIGQALVKIRRDADCDIAN